MKLLRLVDLLLSAAAAAAALGLCPDTASGQCLNGVCRAPSVAFRPAPAVTRSAPPAVQTWAARPSAAPRPVVVYRQPMPQRRVTYVRRHAQPVYSGAVQCGPATTRVHYRTPPRTVYRARPRDRPQGLLGRLLLGCLIRKILD